jgi:hypothetical protein
MTEQPAELWESMRIRAIELRRKGLSFEAIAEELSDERHGQTPWGVYAWCHPEKSPAQIAAWMKRHHPGTETWGDRWLAEYHPDALRRRQEDERRELAYLKSLTEQELIDAYPSEVRWKELWPKSSSANRSPQKRRRSPSTPGR